MMHLLGVILIAATWVLLAPAKDFPGEWTILDSESDDFANKRQCEAARAQYFTGARTLPRTADPRPMKCHEDAGGRMRCEGGIVCEDLDRTEKMIR